MLNSRIFNFFLILFGGIVAVYIQSKENQNVYVLLGGIILLMIGLYRLSKGIPDKSEGGDEDNFIEKDE